MNTIQQLEEKRAKQIAARAEARDAQYAIDLEARIALEETHGTIAAVKVARHVAGQPTLALLKTPTPAQYKRYKDQIHRAVDKKNIASQQEAAELLAKSCWVYPASNDGEVSPEQKAMLEAFPGLLTPMSMAAAALAEGKAEDEGKA